MIQWMYGIVRHEVAWMIVPASHKEKKGNLLSHQQYSTGITSPRTMHPQPSGWHQNREAKVYLLTSKRKGSRVDGMVSTCELLINVVNINKLKRLISLSQNGAVVGKGV